MSQTSSFVNAGRPNATSPDHVGPDLSFRCSPAAAVATSGLAGGRGLFKDNTHQYTIWSHCLRVPPARISGRANRGCGKSESGDWLDAALGPAPTKTPESNKNNNLFFEPFGAN